MAVTKTPKVSRNICVEKKASARRLARSAVMVLAAGVLMGLLALTFFPKQQTAQAILCDNCNPHLPEPGPARAWEVDIPVSTYSRVNTRGTATSSRPSLSFPGPASDRT